jgi:hypothetical protein
MHRNNRPFSHQSTYFGPWWCTQEQVIKAPHIRRRNGEEIDLAHTHHGAQRFIRLQPPLEHRSCCNSTTGCCNMLCCLISVCCLDLLANHLTQVHSKLCTERHTTVDQFAGNRGCYHHRYSVESLSKVDQNSCLRPGTNANNLQMHQRGRDKE